MKRKKLIVYYDIIKEYHAGNKYERDIIEIFSKCGFYKIRYGKQKETKKHKIFSLLKFLFILFFFTYRNSILFFLAPIMEPYDKFFRMVMKIKKWEIYAFIIDINGLRGVGNLENEITNLMYTKGIVAQNDVQKKFLQDSGYAGKIQVMNILDFLYDDIYEKKEDITLPYTVCYGGNLSMKQSEFLYKWSRYSKKIKYEVFVYGINLEEKINNENFHYMGQFSPNEVIEQLRGSFGLVWNGEEIDTCGGSRGEYYKYASPHKLSMYIVARMPVIVWKKSAVNKFVEDNNIGFSIDSLLDIEDKISHISKEDYEKMLNNVEIIREKVIIGYYADTSIKELLKEIS